MKKVIRKIIATVMCASMLGSVIPVDGNMYLDTVFAVENEFVIEDGVLKEYNGTKLIVNVPDGVTEIAASAFKCFGNSKKLCVEKVILPDSVEIIDDWAFYGCESTLTSVEMSPNIYYIGMGAFKGCKNLQSVDLSDTKIEVVQERTFEGCSVLSEVLLPDTVKVIGEQAFYECEKLGRVSLNEGIEHIGVKAFDTCKGLNTIELPTTLTSLGDAAFANCLSLISIKIPAGVTEIPRYCFSGDYSMKSIYLPDTLEIINVSGIRTDNGYTSGAGSMKSIFIPESVKVMYENSIDSGSLYGISPIIEYKAFKDSTASKTLENLKKNNGGDFANTQFVEAQYDANIYFDACGGKLEVSSKEGVVGQMFGGLPTPSLKGWAFKGWYADKEFEKEITCLSIISKSEYTLYAKWEKEVTEDIEYKGELDDFVIKDGKLVSYKGKQSVVVVPDGVTDIGSVFSDNQSIIQIVLPDTVTKIGKLNDCSALRKINIPDGVTELVSNCFANCTALEEIINGKNVTSIGESAFATCTSLENVVLPDNLISMSGYGTFSKCYALKSINLPESLEALGTFCFSNCNSLTEMKIPGKIKTLPRGVFSGDNMLENISLGDGIESIENDVFADCNQLKSIYIPESAEHVDYLAFSDINSNSTDLEIKGFSGSSAFDAYEAILSCCSNINTIFTKMKYDATIDFDSESCGQAIESKKAVTGQIFGTLPDLEKVGYTFAGWSDGNKIIKSTSEVESERVTLTATWIKDGEAEPEKPDTEPEGTPTLLPPSDKEQSEKLEYIDISTADELNQIRNNMSGNYRLVADIDFSQVSQDSGIFDEFGFRPLGSGEDGRNIEGFTGTLEGNGHSIIGLSIQGQVPYKNAGLFARIEGGTVKNLNLVDCKISLGNKPILTGALAGYVGENTETSKEAVVDNVNVSGFVTFSAMSDVPTQNISVGGIFGYIEKARVSNCHNKADVAYYSNEEERPTSACSRFIGGVTGYIQGGSLSCSSNSGSVLSYRKYFGIFDDSVPGDWVSAALSGLDVYDVAGGICGVGAEDGIISECYNIGDVYTYMYNTYELFTLNVTSHMETMSGGIVGALYRGTKVADCYNTGNMYSNSTVDTTILSEEQYFSPDRMSEYMALLDSVTVSAPQNCTAYAGGIVGFSHNNASGPVERCFNTGNIKGSEDNRFPISNGKVPTFYCRYLNREDVEKGCGGYDDKLQLCKGIDSEELKDEYTYRTFDFVNTWLYAEGMEYPQLYNNMQSKVSNVEFVSEDKGNSNVAYGKDVDLSGFKVSFNIRGLENPVVVFVKNSRECGYDRYKEGEQHLCLDYFGVTKEFDVVVLPKHIHNYEMIFTWEENFTGCTAKWTCKDKDREKSVECKVKQTEEKADYEKDGNITYTATALINGQEYTDTKVVTLEKLMQFDLSNAILKMDESYTYSGGEIKPAVQLFNGDELLDSYWYEVSYVNNINAGMGKVIVKAKEGNCPYTGQIEAEFTITKAQEVISAYVSSNEVEAGSSTKITVNNSNDDLKLTYRSENQEVAKVNEQGEITAIAPGTTKIIVSGTRNDNYDVLPCEIDITVLPCTKFNLSDAKIVIEESYEYSGVEITPDVRVYDDKNQLVDDSYYEISYVNNINAGTAKVIVKADEGNGLYIGQIEREFVIKKAKETINAGVDKSELKTGITARITVSNRNDNLKLKYTSQKTSVAKVDDGGKITAIAPGTTKIIVSGTCGNNYEVVACEINIKVLPNTPVIIQADNKTNGINLRWKRDTKVTGYQIYKSKGAGSYKLVKTITNNKLTSWTDTDTKSNGTYYCYKVVSYYKTSSETVKSAKSTGKKILRLYTPAIKSLTNSSKGKCLVSWRVNNSATAYQVKYQTGKTVRTIKISGKNNVSRVLTSLKKGKSYKVSIRAITKKGSSEYYSSWSTVKNIKINK